MRIGISVNSSYPNTDPRTGAQWMIERVQTASQAGLDSLFVGDHHNTGSHYFQNTPMLGRLLADWRGPRAGALFLLPLWQPVLLAEQVATLASIFPHQFILQCGLGGGHRQFEAMGADKRFRPSSFEASLTAIRQLWRGETVDMDGRWTFSGAQVHPIPPEPIDIWIGASAEVAIQRAARLGDGWLATPFLSPSEAATQIELYRSACTGQPGACAIRRDIHLCATEAEAQQFKEQTLAAGHRGFSAEALEIGTVEQMIRRFKDYEAMGYSDVIIRSISTDQREALQSLERLEAVVAAFRSATPAV